MLRYTGGKATVLLALALVLAASRAFAAGPVELSDEQMDGIYAEGLFFDLDLTLDIKDPDSVRIEGGNAGDLQALLQNGLSWQSTGSSDASRAVAGALDPLGGLDPNDLANSIYIGDNALQNTHNLLNLIVMGGDVGVGVNITVILNPVNTNLSLYNFNLNFSNVGSMLVGP
jgi:hypothetical protein